MLRPSPCVCPVCVCVSKIPWTVLPLQPEAWSLKVLLGPHQIRPPFLAVVWPLIRLKSKILCV